ncbi:hypothetical protein A3I95_00560 [Candidatus Nomurabacteria bacterium RIFCSPLOWO2_02_FULL_44_12]|nr:MAG: hypothetical protein A3I95_00560 [Candidatus Nomurabacteria bacterium RIFCSPLOWO2_02_FULL_44_12]
MPERNAERTNRVAELIREFAAKFLARVDNHTSLITVTSASASPDLKRATIFITVMPEEKEEAVLEFVRRQRSELRGVLKKSMGIKTTPFVDFAIDKGEKNRQKIDELLRNG